MRVIAQTIFLMLIGCHYPPTPCGWDENLMEGGSYGLGFTEAYGPDTTTARYDERLDLRVNGVDTIPSCPDIDETGVGRTIVLETTFASENSCSIWYGTVLEPVLPLESRATNFNYFGFNMMTVSGIRDLGGGCRGVWELTVHAPGDDPFLPQNPLDRPVVLAYRYFAALGDSIDACYAVLGLDRATYDYPLCGDAYVAAMDRR